MPAQPRRSVIHIFSYLVAYIPADQCLGPDNFKDLADTSGRGLNVNGSVCLNYMCM